MTSVAQSNLAPRLNSSISRLLELWALHPGGVILTVAAERSSVSGHGAVTGEALPQLQTHTLVVAGVLCAGGAGACKAFTPDYFLILHLHFPSNMGKINMISCKISILKKKKVPKVPSYFDLFWNPAWAESETCAMCCREIITVRKIHLGLQLFNPIKIYSI